MANRLLVIGLFLMLSLDSLSQEGERNQIIEQRIETIVEQLEEGSELDYTTLFDMLSSFYDHPLNLNNATEDELRQLQLLTDLQVSFLLNHIEEHGPLLSIYELQAVSGFDIMTVRNISPFIMVREPSDFQKMTFKELASEGIHDLFLRYTTILEEQLGYSDIDQDELKENPNRRFLGSQARHYLRYRYTYRQNISIGITAEKDPGEQFFRGSQSNGFDFYSGHLAYAGKGWLRSALVGDYQLQFGQGLTLWSSLAFGKSSYTMQVKRLGRGVTPYTSVDENLFLRGGATTIATGPLEWTAFYSTKLIDANLVDATDTLETDEPLVTSFQQSGFHRTPGELTDKDAIRETLYGGNVSYKSRRLKLGGSVVMSDYGADVNRNLQLYNQFEFNDNSNMVVGLDYSYLKNNWNFFGETARSKSGGWATLNGLMVALHPGLSFSVVQRSFQRDFQNLQANVFSESSRPANEQGLYFGAEAILARNLTLSMFFDQFRFPWLRFVTDAPSNGYEGLAQLTYKPSRHNEFYVRYRRKLRSRNAPDEEAIIDYISPELRNWFRVNARYRVSESVTFKSRFEWMTYEHQPESKEHGYLLYHDVIFKKIQFPVSAALRFAVFDTQSYDSRLYAFENDLLYTWSIPAYYNKGTRFYVMLKWDVWRKIDLWVRYSQWYYSNVDQISSGLNMIEGNTKSEFRTQLRVRF